MFGRINYTETYQLYFKNYKLSFENFENEGSSASQKLENNFFSFSLTKIPDKSLPPKETLIRRRGRPETEAKANLSRTNEAVSSVARQSKWRAPKAIHALRYPLSLSLPLLRLIRFRAIPYVSEPPPTSPRRVSHGPGD